MERTVEVSKRTPGVGDRLLIYHATAWQGGRIGDITGLVPPTPAATVDGTALPMLANARVTLDLTQDISLIRGSIPSLGRAGSGDAFHRFYSHLNVYEPLSPKDRAIVRGMTPVREELGANVWLEWAAGKGKVKT